MSIYEEALRLVRSGLSVLPIRADGTKRPWVEAMPNHEWGYLQERLPTETEVQRWWGNGAPKGIALIAGAVSGNAELIDFDDTELVGPWIACVKDAAPDLIDRLVVVRTPRPGFAVWYRCEGAIPGNQKLAMGLREEIDPGTGEIATKRKALIETRGEGGYALIPPSPPECHPKHSEYLLRKGDLAALPLIRADEREILIEAARALTEIVEPERAPRSAPKSGEAEGDRPGDQYNQRGDFAGVLEQHGWRRVYQRGDGSYWRRPGKDRGWSASLGVVAPGVLNVFSTNADPLENRAYDLFGAYCHLAHHGDFTAATKALREQGYGALRAPRPRSGPNGASVPGADPGSEEAPGVEGERSERKKAAAEPANDLLAQEWAESVRDHFVFVEGDEWRCYRDNRWCLASDTTVDHSIYRWLHDERLLPSGQIKKSRIVEMRFLAQSLLGHPSLGPLPMARFNANPELLPLANTVLNVRTRETFPHQPNQYHTYCLPYDYDPDAGCPEYLAFQQQVMIDEAGKPCDEWCDLLEQWMGYCLIPDCSAEGTLVNIGEGGNGKGVWAKILEGLVGDENCGSINLRTLELKEDLVMANLHGKLVAFINEPTRMQLTGCSGSIKAIVSGDKVEGKRLYHASFYYRPHLRLVVSCNDMMETKDLSGGFFRRLMMVGWNYRPATPDRRLAPRLLRELPGILNLALDGLDRLRANGFEFPEPEASRTLKADYWYSQDSAKQFLEACCDCDVNNADLWCQPSELHRRYAAWCKEAGYAPLNRNAFGKHLTRRLGYPAAKSRREGVHVFDVRYGISLRAQDSFPFYP